MARAGRALFHPHGQASLERKTEVAIRFKQAPYTPFRSTPVFCLPDNWLIISIAPDEGISLQFAVKRPGPVVDRAGVRMDFRDNDWFPNEPNVGYETLIYDVMMGDQTLFMRADMVEEAWRVVEPGWTPGRTMMEMSPPMCRAAKDRWKPMAFSHARATSPGGRSRSLKSGNHERGQAPADHRGDGRFRLRQIDGCGAPGHDARMRISGGRSPSPA